MSLISRAIKRAYPGLVRRSHRGFYWENADMPPARFVFSTFVEAAEDVAVDIGMDDTEAREILLGKDTA